MTYLTTASPVGVLCADGIYKLPPFGVPAILPNQAMYSMVKDICEKFTISGLPVVVGKGEIPMSMGDVAGAMGGVISAKVMGPAKATNASSKMFLNGEPVVRNTDPCTNNDNNGNGTQLGPSQTKFQVMS